MTAGQHDRGPTLRNRRELRMLCPTMDAKPLSIHDPGEPKTPAIIFLNGFLTNRAMWATVIEHLGDAARCITYDLRSFGENQTGDGVVSIEAHAGDLIRLLDRCGVERPLLCGHSLGGLVALRAAARDRERFAGLVVCGAHAKSPSDDERLQWAGWIDRADSLGPERFAQHYLEAALAQDTIDQPGSPFDLLVEEAATQSITASKAALLAIMARVDTLAPLERAPLPLLITGGAGDRYTPPDALLRMGLGIQGAQFVRVPHAGHLAPVDNPAFFADALLRFLHSEPVTARLPQKPQSRKKR